MPSILVVDDVATDRVRAAGLASRWMNSTVLQADNGITALAMIEKHQPDMVLTDLNMEGMNGLQLVEAIRNEYPYIPVILMTADGSEDIAAQALQKGAASYLPKRLLAQSLERILQQVHVTARDAQIQTDVMHQIQSTDTQLVLYNDRGLIRAAVGLLVNLLRCMPLGNETERMRVGVALEEALLNACYHGNLEVTKCNGNGERGFDSIVADRISDKSYGQRRIHIRAMICREHAQFTIRDDGTGFDPTPFLSARGKPLDVHHRGINLMSTIMDSVIFNAAGNEVTMTKKAVLGSGDGSEDAAA
jgi:CheY-like chemotaxis protein